MLEGSGAYATPRKYLKFHLLWGACMTKSSLITEKFV